MASKAIAKTVLYGQRLGEPRFKITIEIGRPYRRGRDPEEWACPVALKPLYARLADMSGNDSLQALSLAIALIHSLLEGFVEDGGTLTYEGGENFPLDAYPAMRRP